MTGLTLMEKINNLPPAYRQEVEDFVDFIREKKLTRNGANENKPRQFGLLKGKMWMSPDFDEPLEDFKDYM